MLTDHGISIILDLREVQDRVAMEICAHFDITYISCSLDNSEYGHEIMVPSDENYAKYYLSTVSHCGDAIVNVFRYLACADGPTVYGCNLGKDRTGIISYFLLIILNASLDDICDDYLHSAMYLRANSAVRNYFISKDKNDYSSRCSVSIGAMLLFDKLLRESYRTPEHYLVSSGLKLDEIRLIRKKWSI